MRFFLAAFGALFLLAGNSCELRAQTNAAPATPSDKQLEREKMMISFLTPEEQEKYAKARAKALEDNPELKAEGQAIAEQGVSVMSDGNPAERQAFLEKMGSHRQKLRTAMLKEDGTLGPIFAEIDQHISEMKAKHLGQVQSSGAPTTVPGSGSSTP